MKLHLKMVGGDEITVKVPDDYDRTEFEFMVKTGHIMTFGELKVNGTHVQAWQFEMSK